MPAGPRSGLPTAAAHRMHVMGMAAATAGALTLASWRCPVHAVTGWYCPGCGGTRAVGALLRGDLVGALRDNLLLFTVLPLVAVAVSRPDGSLAHWLERHRTSVIVSAGVIAVAYVLLRNTSLPWLAPL
jgi:hypothetical protein